MGIRQIGYSDLGYFYRGVGDLTRNLIMDMEFRERVDRDLLARALGQALDDYPEFAVQPFRDGFSFVYREQHRAVPILPMDDRTRCFGTEEMGGYLFCVRAGEKKVRFSAFHGLTDAKGCLGFCRTVLYHYGRCRGMNFSMANPGRCAPLDREDQFDPFGKYAAPSGTSTAGKSSKEPQEPILILPADDFPAGDPRIHAYELELSTGEVLRLTKQLGTTVAPILTTVLAEALDALYGGEGKAVLSFLPVNMLELFGSRTRVNFNLSIPLLVPAELLQQDLPAQCHAIRAQMNRQIGKEKFAHIMRENIEKTRCLQEGMSGIRDAQKKPAITYNLSYPGRMDIDEEFLPLISDWRLLAWSPIAGCSVIGYTQGDKMVIHIDRRSDSSAIPKAAQEVFGKIGLQARLVDFGYNFGDRLIVEKLSKKVD